MKSDKPYITKRKIVIERLYNTDFGDDKVCGCGHSYYRHFDTYEEMSDVGCKYCDCRTWHPIPNEEEKLKKQNENTHSSGTEAS